MIAHEYLRTIEIQTDWDLPLVRTLSGLAIFYCDEGVWEGIDEVAQDIMERFKEDRAMELSMPLRRAYNTMIIERRKADFELEDAAANEALVAAEQALVNELLDYHADPKMYVIVHALDEAYGDEAWLLCYLEDIEELGLDKGIHA
jgi:hypothetical protein